MQSISSLPLVTLGVLLQGHFAQAKVDCSDAIPWSSRVVGNGPWKVHHNSVKYTASNWVDSGNEPGVNGWSPWQLVGPCMEGTTHETAKIPETEDCTNIHSWSASTTYSSSNTHVQYEGAVFTNKWWTRGDQPNVADRGGPWSLVGGCITPTTSTAAPTTAAGTTGSDSSAASTTGTTAASTTAASTAASTTAASTAASTTTASTAASTTAASTTASTAAPTTAAPVTTTATTTRATTTTPRATTTTPRATTTTASTPATTGADGVEAWGCEMLGSAKCLQKQTFIPYVDVGLGGWPDIDDLRSTEGVDHIFVGPVLAAVSPQLRDNRCRGSFAGLMSLDAGPTYDSLSGETLYMYDNLFRLRDDDGDFILTFGGDYGRELADDPLCQQDPEALLQEYHRALRLTNSSRINIDMRGPDALTSPLGWQARNYALGKLSRDLGGEGKLQVIYTLPITKDGLTNAGRRFVDLMITSGGPWTIFNGVHTDTDCSCSGKMEDCMLDGVKKMAEQIWRMLESKMRLPLLGWTDINDLYKRMGTTPVIGQHTTSCLNLSVKEAKSFIDRIHRENIPLRIVSMINLNRDSPCTSGILGRSGSGGYQADCSGASDQTKDYEFIEQFNCCGV